MIELSPTQMVKQKKLMFKLNHDIRNISFKINHQKLEMIKNNIIKQAKINLCRGKLVAPYVIAASLCVSVGSIFGATPFIIDKEKSYLKIMDESDSLGNTYSMQQYENFSDDNNVITYYDKWYQNNDSSFSRNIKIYNMGEVTSETIQKLLNKQSDWSLERLFGDPIINRMETKNKLTEEEKNSIPHIQARYYSVSDNDYIFVDEPLNSNVIETVINLLILLILETFIHTFRVCFPFNYQEKINKINKKYSTGHIDDLMKQLEIRLNNFERLNSYKGVKELKKSCDEVKRMISGEVFKYTNPNECINFSSIDGEELQKLFVLIDELYLQIRQKLNIDKNVTFGYEIELENVKVKYISEQLRNNYLSNWKLVLDGSLENGIEINSPILHDTKESWSQLDRVCVAIQKGSNVGKNSAGHFHSGTQLLGDNPRTWLNFIKFYAVNENIISRFMYGEYLTNRESLEKFAGPVACELWDDYLYLKDKNASIEEIIKRISHGKYKAINFNNVKVDKINEFEEHNTVEVRWANDTKESSIHQNNFNFFYHMVMYAKSNKFNDEILDRRHSINNGIYNDLDWYNEIYLEQALEVCDLIYNTNLDKIYFLKQYLKSFEVSHDEFRKIKKSLTKSIKY